MTEPLFDVAGFEVFGGVLFTGLVTGLTYALLGAGLVLVYRATRVINVAQGELGVFGAIAGPAWVVGVPMLFGDTQAARLAASGIGLLVLLMYLPGGFAGVVTSVRDK
nr:hypothetical protein [Micromonospora sp. DSM 115978]